MKAIVLFKFVFLPFIVILPASQPSKSPWTILGVFAGTSLCADVSRPLLNIPSGAQCDRTKWNLTLFVDRQTQAPTTYKLSTEYGYHIDNRTLVMKGSNEREGKWAIVKGAKADPNAAVFQLDPANTQMTISFQQIDPNLIHLLERDGSLVIGSAAQSFTLSRIDKKIEVTEAKSKAGMSSSVAPPGASGLGPVAVFGGRSPCREVAQQLNHPVERDCFKLKWAVTLYQDATLTPTTFKLRGTLFRDFDRTGTWTVLRGRPGQANETVYQLNFDKNEGSLLFLKADENILFFLHNDGSLMVGNSDFSYTLNRDK